MKVSVIIQTSEKVNDVLAILKKRSKVFDGEATLNDVYDWTDSFINSVGDVKIIRADED